MLIRLFLVLTLVPGWNIRGNKSLEVSFLRHPELTSYLKEDKEEKRLTDFRDSEEVLSIKLYQLDLINESRRKYKASALRLDILASRLANKNAAEASANQYISHWNLKGEKPYHRYAFAGGMDHITENIYYEQGSNVSGPYKQDVTVLLKNGHGSFMAEKPPYDGHKKACIDKGHTHVGIGYAIAGDVFSYYEEYVARYLTFIDVPDNLKVNESSLMIFKPIKEGKFPYFMVIYRDDLPTPKSPKELNKTGSYSDFTTDKTGTFLPWELTGLKRNGEYRIPLKFEKPGLYYLMVYLNDKEIVEQTGYNTAGLSPVSGVVIRVTK